MGTASPGYEVRPHCDKPARHAGCPGWVVLLYGGRRVGTFRTGRQAAAYISAHPQGPVEARHP